MADNLVFPPSMGTAIEVQIRDAYLAIAELEKSKQQAMQIAQATVTRHSNFFSAHYGLDPVKGILETHINGKNVMQGAQTLQIAQTIASYQNPDAASHGVTTAITVGILNSLVKIPLIDAQIAQKQAEVLPLLKDAVYTLDSRPTAEAIKAYIGKMSHTDVVDKEGNMLYGYQQPPAEVMGQYYYRSTHREKSYYPGYLAKGKVGDLVKPVNNYYIFPKEVLSYYSEAYKRDPAYFWKFTEKNRLTVETTDVFWTGYYVIKVYEVNPVTGGATGRYLPVAAAKIELIGDSPSAFIADFKRKYFPEMNLLNEKISYSTDRRQAEYQNQFNQIKDIWTGVSSKGNTPLAYILTQDFQFPSQDRWEKVTEAVPGKTTAPISKLGIYMQPTGIEEAMKRMLNFTGGNSPIYRWFVSIIPEGGNMAPSNGDGKTVSFITNSLPRTQGQSNPMQGYTYTYNVVLNALYHVLSTPKLYSKGYDALLAEYEAIKEKEWDDHWKNYRAEQIFGSSGASDQRFKNLSYQYFKSIIAHIRSIFTLSGWPAGAPQLLTEFPIDEPNDAVEIISSLENYLKQNFAAVPGQVFVPEGFNGQMTTNVHYTPANVQNTGQGGDPQYEIKFTLSSGAQYPYSWSNGKTKRQKIYFGFTNIEMMYLTRTATVVSRKSVAMGLSPIKFPKQLAPVQPIRSPDELSKIDATNIAAGAALTAAAMVVGGPVGAAVAVGGMALTRYLK